MNDSAGRKMNQVLLVSGNSGGILGFYDGMQLCLFEVGEGRLTSLHCFTEKESHERTGYQRR